MNTRYCRKWHFAYVLCSQCDHCKKCGQYIALGRYKHNRHHYICNDCDWSTYGTLEDDIAIAFKSKESTWDERCDTLLNRACSIYNVLDIYHAFKQACVVHGTGYMTVDMKKVQFEEALARLGKHT